MRTIVTQQAEWTALPWEPNKDGGQRWLAWLPSVPIRRGLTLIIFTGTFHSIKYNKSYDLFIDQVNTGSCSFYYQIKRVWTRRHLNPAGTHTHQQTQTTESVWFRLEEVWSQNTQDVWTDTNWNFSIRNSVIQINLVIDQSGCFQGLQPETYLRAGRRSSCPTCWLMGRSCSTEGLTAHS